MHVLSPKGDAKFWIEPKVEAAHVTGLKEKDVRLLQKIVEERKDEIKKE